MKVDYVIIASAMFIFILCAISTVVFIQTPEPSLRLQMFAPLMMLLAIGVALVFLIGVVNASKKALANDT